MAGRTTETQTPNPILLLLAGKWQTRPLSCTRSLCCQMTSTPAHVRPLSTAHMLSPLTRTRSALRPRLPNGKHDPHVHPLSTVHMPLTCARSALRVSTPAYTRPIFEIRDPKPETPRPEIRDPTETRDPRPKTRDPETRTPRPETRDPRLGLQASKADASALTALTAYALLSAVDTSSEVGSEIAAALLGAVTTAALDAGLAGKADASVLAALLSTVDGLDTPLEVDTKIASALLGLATEAFVVAQLASRDASITALQARRCWPRMPRSQPARPRSRAPSTQSSRISPPCSFPAAAELLTRRPGRASLLGSSFAEATSFANCIWRLLSLLK